MTSFNWPRGYFPRRDFSKMKRKRLIISLVFSATYGVRGDIVVNSVFGSTAGDGAFRIPSFGWKDSAKVRLAAPDLDEGPYCFLNSTTNKMQTSAYVTSGFVVTGSACRSNCDLAGCTEYRLDSVSSMTYSKQSQCAVAEAFHYSLTGSRRERWCPYHDWIKSVFSFRGREYKDQWYWLGWSSENDCMNAILCGPTSHYFDVTQRSSLAWCQPVPAGFYSPACANSISPCSRPSFADDMRLAFWTSHGFGQADGCGVRAVTPAVMTAFDSSAIEGEEWSISCKVLSSRPLLSFPINQPRNF